MSEAMTAQPLRPNGASVAAYLSATFGSLVLGIVVLVTELNTAAKDVVFNLGKAWIPGAAGIGPYSGRETALLIGWLGSWIALHFALRGRQVSVRWTFAIAMITLLVAAAVIWPPTWHVFE